MRAITILTGVLIIGLLNSATRAQSATDDTAVVHDGEDVTVPLQRIDLRVNFMDSPKGRSETYTIRSDNPQKLVNGDTFSFRIDIPIITHATTTPDNPDGARNTGLGDVLLQALYAHPLNEAEAFGVGTQLILPTASEGRFGTGRWQVLPTAGYRWSLPMISDDSFFTAATRYDVSIGGSNGRANISNLRFAPTLNIGLPDKMYFSFYPSTEIRYDFIKNSFFLPIDCSVGKFWAGHIITSLEGSAAVIRDANAPYTWKIEARIGFLF